MAFYKGMAKIPNSGRKAGTKNKKPSYVRDIYQSILEKQASKLDEIINRIEDPYKQAEMILKLSEFCIGKVNRTVIEENNSEPVHYIVSWKDSEFETKTIEEKSK